MVTQDETTESKHGSRGWVGKLIAALLVIGGASVVGLVAVMPRGNPPAPPTDPPAVNVEVRVIRPFPEMIDAFNLPGIVEPNRVVNVAAEVAGRIDRIDCREGRPCRKGDKMIHLNKDLLQAEYDRTKAQAEFDEREYGRITQAYERNVATNTELDQARTRSEASKAAFRAAEARLERATIIAPISGILNRLPVEVGEYVRAGDEVAVIVDVETVKVIVQVPERDVYYVKLGEMATIFVDSLDGKELRGKITYMSELADERTRTTRIEVEVDNKDRLLRSGQNVRVRLTRRVLKDVIMVPLGAVIPLEEGRAVYVVENDEAERREVKLGFMKGSRVRILEGLKAGNKLIVAGHRFVATGQTVNVVRVVED